MFDPWWFVSAACVVITALAILVIAVLAIARRVVDKSRPEDLPAVLAGLGDVVASLACFLPWGKTRENPPSEPALPQGGEVLPPPVTIVAGQLAATHALNPPALPGEVNR
ncbi:hypothetical protein OOK13_44835 [Streptomyces sp. NBC_00378]|uniref:hypothetical protein n=1 Tax=unclassified Streptomyces TaxID=2593676 RepID=UPI00225378BA|nr:MULTISPECIES: hypothetical protein [unclassified Streptomyces]MCX5115429.1 hypothetical protein [Streptomyces sp. NBC_00378]